jgi:hypothetical protein
MRYKYFWQLSAVEVRTLRCWVRWLLIHAFVVRKVYGRPSSIHLTDLELGNELLLTRVMRCFSDLLATEHTERLDSVSICDFSTDQQCSLACAYLQRPGRQVCPN